MKETPAHKCWSKATRNESGQPRHSLNWALARRAWFRIYGDRAECGDWVIPFSEVRQATLYRTRRWTIPLSVLELRTETDAFQFGFNPWADPVRHLPLQIEERPLRTAYSPFSVFLRILFIAALAYLIWTRLRR